MGYLLGRGNPSTWFTQLAGIAHAALLIVNLTLKDGTSHMQSESLNQVDDSTSAGECDMLGCRAAWEDLRDLSAFLH